MMANPSPEDRSLEKMAAAAPAENLGTIAIEYYPVSGSPERAEFTLEKVTYIQGALEQTGALDRFRREKIYLYRKPPGQAVYSKLNIAFDASKGRVPPSSDYALRGGDRLVISEDPSDIFDDLLDRLDTGLLGSTLIR